MRHTVGASSWLASLLLSCTPHRFLFPPLFRLRRKHYWLRRFDGEMSYSRTVGGLFKDSDNGDDCRLFKYVVLVLCHIMKSKYRCSCIKPRIWLFGEVLIRPAAARGCYSSALESVWGKLKQCSQNCWQEHTICTHSGHMPPMYVWRNKNEKKASPLSVFGRDQRRFDHKNLNLLFPHLLWSTAVHGNTLLTQLNIIRMH